VFSTKFDITVIAVSYSKRSKCRTLIVAVELMSSSVFPKHLLELA